MKIRAQSILEYVIIMGVVAAAVVGILISSRGAVNARLDEIKQVFVPKVTTPTPTPTPGGGGGGGGCFLKGTKIALADGTSKPIEEIKKGDLVFGYDGKQVKAGKVVKTFFHPKTKGYRVISTEEGQQINVTDIHLLFNGKTYLAARRFKVGDNLFVLKENKLQAVKIKSIKELKNSINDVYNLHIDKLHNYFVEGILCHNRKAALLYTE